MAETYGLAAEIRNLELKLNKRHDKAVKALKTRIDELEAIVGKLGAWIASKQRGEAQEKLDDSSVIHKRDDSGETWLKPSKALMSRSDEISIYRGVPKLEIGYVCGRCRHRWTSIESPIACPECGRQCSQ